MEGGGGQTRRRVAVNADGHLGDACARAKWPNEEEEEERASTRGDLLRLLSFRDDICYVASFLGCEISRPSLRVCPQDEIVSRNRGN